MPRFDPLNDSGLAVAWTKHDAVTRCDQVSGLAFQRPHHTADRAVKSAAILGLNTTVIGSDSPQHPTRETFGVLSFPPGRIRSINDQGAMPRQFALAGEPLIGSEIGQILDIVPRQVDLAGSVAAILAKLDANFSATIVGQCYSSPVSQRVASSSSRENL